MLSNSPSNTEDSEYRGFDQKDDKNGDFRNVLKKKRKSAFKIEENSRKGRLSAKSPPKNRLWKQEEDELLILLDHSKHCRRWKIISSIIGGNKTPRMCAYRLGRINNKNKEFAKNILPTTDALKNNYIIENNCTKKNVLNDGENDFQTAYEKIFSFNRLEDNCFGAEEEDVFSGDAAVTKEVDVHFTDESKDNSKHFAAMNIFDELILKLAGFITVTTGKRDGVDMKNLLQDQSEYLLVMIDFLQKSIKINDS